MNVYLLWHTHVFQDGSEDDKLIGVFSSQEYAEQAQLRAGSLPGFRENPKGFVISRFAVDQDLGWKEGFVTVPVNGSADLYNDVTHWRDDWPFTEAMRRELDRRIAAHEASPAEAIPWEIVKARLMGQG